LKPRVVVLGSSELLRARTARSLARAGANVDDACDASGLAGALEPDAPTWILRAGAWVSSAPEFVPSATKKPVVAFGAIAGDGAWSELLARSNGIFGRAVGGARVASVLVESPGALRRALQTRDLDDAAWELARDPSARAVRFHDIDVGYDERVRACIAITALRRGGAERVAIDTTNALRRAGVCVLFAVMGAPRAGDYDPPEGTVWVRELASRHAELVPALASAAERFGADVVHAHLFEAQSIRELASAGLPVVVTVHNDRARWPEGFGVVATDAAALTLACSWSVRDAVAAELPALPLRVAPNAAAPERTRSDREKTRRELEVPRDALLVLCVANARRQKRLDLAVEALVSLRRTCDARLVLVGDPVVGEDGASAHATLTETIERTGVGAYVRRLGARDDVGALLAAADVFLTTSEYEGMSVAQLEALAARVPVVTTEVGGARELARAHASYRVAAPTPDDLAREVALAARGERPSLATQFTPPALASRHERAYRGAALRAGARRGLVLVINNFSTGGAQASARRLLLALRARGHDVAAAVFQEQARFPTTWRAELERALPVFVGPTRGSDAAASAASIAAFVQSRRARTVVFWNAMTAHKLLVADELAGLRLFDVSPGEMYFSALERYFQAPRPDLPYGDAREYGTLLEGAVVKFAAEAGRARRILGTRVHVVPNGVPTFERPPRGARDRFVIGTLARISPDKKLEELLEAARALPAGCEVRIAGRIERGCEAYERALRESARDLPVVFCGEVDSSAFLAEVDAFAMVSEPEGCPNALLEAMGAGLAVAATRVGGASDAITDGATGLLVPRGDGGALGLALARVATDAPLRERLGDAARARVREAYSVERMTDAYEALFFDD
jgi:glycosyltransferase involved in cell wall biosynthesis